MKVDTRLAKGAPAISTELSLDWTGVTPEQMKELAGRSLVISWQRVCREAGKIPATDNLKVADFLKGVGRPDKVVTPEKIMAEVPKMTPEARAELLKALQAAEAPKKK